MDPIDGLSKLMEALRRQQATGNENVKRRKSQGRNEEPSELHRSAKPNIEQFERRLTERLQGLNLEDEARYRKGTRIFLEAVLTWELGEDLIQDARFADMVEHVETQMRSQPEISAKLDRLLDQMMRG